ncbi:MAG TPA: sulfatase [Verrucomicrobiales bacterium]|nr:sulfatase [Verrucomicrobiales bacterium]HRJ10510.1 sulfatase-like hydrolase/transferase [Prosthecobacter sp.]HRK14495.1 sulfatase-like hydrolase/transferase [Prosthecobacter sp.]
MTLKHLLPAALCCLLVAMPLPAVEKRPNFLFILVDDQAPFDLKVYDPKSPLDTPNLDRLAAQGVVFDGAYQMGSFSGAVCMPSRHMIMSGRTVWHLPPAPWGAKTCPPNLEQNSIPAVFNRAGYATMRTCKTGNSYEAANKLFTVRHDASKRGGDDETGSTWHGDRVMDYLRDRESAKDDKPFFIFYGFSHPHDTRDGRPELLAKYGAVNHTDEAAPPSSHSLQPGLPPNYLPGHPFDMTHADVRDEVAVSGVWKRRDEASIRNEIGRQYACSENIDIQIGRVLKRLEETGELDNTFIIYTADHGMSIGRHGLMGKQNLYQHTWRVPFIVKGPGIPAGRRVEGNIYLLDILATFCDLAGIPAPETNEGLSFKPVLLGEKPVMRDVLYGAYSGGSKPGIRTVKKGDWKLVRYESPDRSVNETQLFNLAENPDELLPQHHDPKVAALTGNMPKPEQTNLASDAAHAAKLAEMQALLLAEMRRLNDPWRFSDQPDDNLPAPPAPQPRGKGKGKAGK